jgi:hypothetical protein
MPGFALALLVVHLASVPLGRAAALALGLTTTLAWSGALLLRHAQAARRRQAIR